MALHPLAVPGPGLGLFELPSLNTASISFPDLCLCLLPKNIHLTNDEFLENEEFSGNIYGTSKKSVEHVLSSGRICALDVDIQGVKSLKKSNFCGVGSAALF